MHPCASHGQGNGTDDVDHAQSDPIRTNSGGLRYGASGDMFFSEQRDVSTFGIDEPVPMKIEPAAMKIQ